MSYISLGFCLLSVLSPTTRHAGPAQKHVRPSELVELREELERGKINGVKRRLANSILVVEYRRLQPDLVVGPVKDLSGLPWPLLPEDGSAGRFFCTMQRISRRDTAAVDRLLKALKNVLVRTWPQAIESGPRLELSQISDLSPSEGVYGRPASNVEWIVQTRTIHGKFEIVGIVLATH
jgi:hypothetical protein